MFVLNTETIQALLPINKPVFSEHSARMFDIFMNKDLPQTVTIPEQFKDCIECVYNYYHAHNACKPLQTINTVKIPNQTVQENKNVIVGLSGGLDSCYLALKLKTQGYNVTTMHVNKLNTYAAINEDKMAKEYSEHAGIKYIAIDHKRTKSNVYFENPLRNQLVMSFMLDYALENNITNIAIGSDWTEPLSECQLGLDVTDSKEVNETFWNGVKQTIQGMNLIFCEDNVKKVDRIKFILDTNKELFEDVYSCVMANRFVQSFKKKNEEKYKIKLLKNRCGSCVKCCREFLYLCHLGFYNNDEIGVVLFKDHCWDILGNSKFALQLDKYGLDVPLQKRWENLLNQGS